MKLKLCTTGKLFGKICLKAVKILFPSMWSAMKRGMGWGMKERDELNFLVGSGIQQKGEIQNLGHEWGEPYPGPP